MHIGSSYAVQNNQSLLFMKTFHQHYCMFLLQEQFLCMLHSSFVLARIFVRYSHCCALDVYKSLASTPHLDVLINTHLLSGILVT